VRASPNHQAFTLAPELKIQDAGYIVVR